jgi:HlyD family secretion protein
MHTRSRSRSLRDHASQRGAILLKALVAGVTLAAGGSGVLVVVGEASQVPKPGAKQPGAVDLGTVDHASFDVTITSTGQLKAKEQKEVRNETENETTIVEIVPEGSRVRKGEQIIRLNSDTIKTQVDEELLRVESAKAELVAAENGYEIQKSENESKVRQAQLKLDLALLDLSQWDKGERVQKEKDIELALDKTAKDLERLEEKYKRSQQLFEQGFYSKDQLQQDEIALRDARAARAKAELEHQTYATYQLPKDRKTKESAVEEAKAEIARTNQQNDIQLVSKEADRINKRRQLDVRQERLTKLNKQFAACTINAPQDGLVVYGSSLDGDMYWNNNGPIQVGRKVFPNEVMITLPDTSSMIAQVKVHESLAGRVHPGQPATVKVDAAGGQTFVGKIDSIGVLAESGGWRDPNRREYTVKILLDSDPASAGLKPSMSCEASVQLDHAENVAAVPLQAVFNEERLSYLWTPDGSKFRRVPVTVGRRSDTLAEITSAIEPGTRVLLRDPMPGERILEPWTDAMLQPVGFKIAKNGKPAPIAADKPATALAAKPEAKPAADAKSESKPDVIAVKAVEPAKPAPIADKPATDKAADKLAAKPAEKPTEKVAEKPIDAKPGSAAVVKDVKGVAATATETKADAGKQ